MAPRIVVIAAFVPRIDADNAGQRYLGELARLLPDSTTFIVHGDEKARRDLAASPDARVELLTIDPTTIASPPSWLRQRVNAMLHPVRVRDGFWQAMRDTPRARNAIARADVIDLQWPEFVTLAPRIARVAPSARIVATMHDVHSQNLARMVRSASTFPSRARRMVSMLRTRRIEREVAEAADLMIVFSHKDRRLLPRNSRAAVVHPPAMSAYQRSVRGAARTGETMQRDRRVLSIGPLARGENVDGLQWFAREVWPAVREAVPSAQLVHAGSFDERHPPLFADTDVELLGFVDNLDDLQQRVGVVIAPIQQGAGVKFKVVDALHDEVPIVATSVGIEGIGDGNFSVESFDTPSEFATAVIIALTDTVGASLRARSAGDWARDRYGWPQFERSIKAVYGLQSTAPTANTSSDEPIASIVIPVRNGENGLPNALAALARQAEASQLEVIVSDNGSTDRTRQVAAAWSTAFQSLRIVDAGDRPGVGYARNRGIVAATSERILITDDDDEVRLGWATALIEALDSADAAGGRIVSGVVSGQHEALDSALESTSLQAVHGYLPYATGTTLAVKRSVALQIGGFDESFQRGHDEVEFCWRLQRAGYNLVGVDDAIIDYRQRERAIDAARQRFHSARTSIQLWARYERLAPLSPVSFSAAARGVATSLVDAPGLLRPSTRFTAARRLGWSWGTLVGHLKYRKFGRPPAATLLEGTST